MIKPSVGVYHDCRRETASRLYPIKISVTFRRNEKFIQRYYSTEINLSKEDYKSIQTSDVRGRLKRFADDITTKKAKAIDIINTYTGISPDLFSSMFNGKFISSSTVKFFYDKIIIQHRQRGSTQGEATAVSYECSLKSISSFSPGDLLLVNIDKEWLEQYHSWMRSNGRKDVTVGIYLRCLRAAFNAAIDAKVINSEYYPFGKKGFVIPSGENIKKTLIENNLQKLINLEPESYYDKVALMYWKFSYYCVGMNFKDIAYLKRENIQGDAIVYFRQKTFETKRFKKPIVVHIHPEAEIIIKKMSTNQTYLFGVINDDMTAKQKFDKVAIWRRNIVDRLQAMADANNINQRIVIYTARHTSANKLLTNGTDIKTLQNLLGHSSLTSTEHYVSGLPYNKQKEKILQL